MVLASCLVLLPATLAIAWGVNRTSVDRWNEMRDESALAAATAAAYLDEQFQSVDVLASALLRHPAVASIDEVATHRAFRELVHAHPFLARIFVSPVSRDGRAPVPQESRDAGRNDAPQSAATTHGIARHVGEFLIDKLSGRPVITVEYPIVGESGVRLGVLGLTIDLMQLQARLAELPLPSDAVVTVFDRAHRVILRSVNSSAYVGTIVEAGNREGLPRSDVRVDVDGVERLSGEAALDNVPWTLSAGTPRALITTRAFPYWQRRLTFALTTLVATVFLLWWYAQRMGSHIKRLESAILRVADGDLSPPAVPPVSNLELHGLQDAFVNMAANLREARNALDRQLEHERAMNDRLQALQRQVVRQERLAAVGLLASGVAHEINNPLQAILGASALLERQDGLSSEAQHQIDFVKVQSTRASEIIRSLARFTSSELSPRSPVRLRDVVTDVLALRARDLESPRLTVEVEDTSSRSVFGNFTELEQVIQNFILNAQHAVDGRHSSKEKGCIQIRMIDSRDRIRLEVNDNGPGVAVEDEAKLFQPFFTTRPVGQGVGLGLSVSYGIIQSYGGTIGYLRNAWGGATFFFELPALHSSEAEERPDEMMRDTAAVLRRPLQS